MDRLEAQLIVCEHINDGFVYDWTGAWEWSGLRRLNSNIEAPGAGALRQLIDVMADLAPQGALDEVLAFLKRTGLIAGQPTLIPRVISNAKSRKQQRDIGVRPHPIRRKLRFAEINNELQACSMVAAFLFARIDEPAADEMESVLSLHKHNDGDPSSFLAHIRMYGAFITLARKLEQMDGLMSDLD